MKLTLESGLVIPDPPVDAIVRGVASEQFAILERDEGTYIQCLKRGNAPFDYVLEYRDGSLELHYEAADGHIKLDRVVGAFVAFLQGDDAWKRDFRWVQLDLETSQGNDSCDPTDSQKMAGGGLDSSLVTCPQCNGCGDRRCPECRGSGHSKCPACGGCGTRGLVDVAIGRGGNANAGGIMRRSEQCLNCKGTGFVGGTCPECGGAGNLRCPMCGGRGRVSGNEATEFRNRKLIGCGLLLFGAVVIWILIQFAQPK